MKKYLIIVFTLVQIGQILGQHVFPCGISHSDQQAIVDQIDEHKQWIQDHPEARTNAIRYVPVKIHIVNRTSGTGGIYHSNILDMICNLNRQFQDQNIQFYIKDGFNNINNDVVYNTPNIAGGEIVMNGQRDPKAMNIFLCSSAGTQGVLGYFTRTRDWLVIKNSEVNGTAGTLPHEAGHFFNLAHTFYGWEDNAYKEATHGNPCLLVNAPGVPNVLVEQVNRDNCQNEADKLCDTPADWNFGFGWDGCKPYTKIIRDRSNDTLNPMEENFMGYFIGCTNYIFTPQQKGVVLANLNHSSRNYLNNSFAPSATEILTDCQVIAPNWGDSLLKGNNVTLSWTPATGANAYLLEYCRQDSSYSEVRTTKKLVVGATQFTIDGSTLGEFQYYWRVRPFNENITCAEFTSKGFGKFKIVKSISARKNLNIHNLVLAPNPVKQGLPLYLNFDINSSKSVDIDIVNVLGKVVQSRQSVALNNGNNSLEILTDGLTPGIYFASLSNQEGISTIKFIIQ